MKYPVQILGSGLLSALGRERGELVAGLRDGLSAPATLTLPDLGFGSRFLFQQIPDGHVPAGEGRLDALVEVAVADALTAAGLSDSQRRKLPVFVGSSSMDLGPVEALAIRVGGEPPLLVRQFGWGIIAERLTERFDLRGRRFSFSTACSSAANALLAAMEQVASGRLEHALVVGVECGNQLSLHGFNSLRLLAEDDCRPFDRDRGGMVLGEGAAAVVIGRGDGVSTLLGGANRSDPGNVTRPTVEGMTATMDAALRAAALSPADISAIKAHGTGTESNDAAEGEALRRYFGDALPPVTSLKPQLGYTLGANTLLELVAWLWSLEAGMLPPTPNFKTMDPTAGIAPLSKAMSMSTGNFLLNCFGFGGNNTCLVVKHG